MDTKRSHANAAIAALVSLCVCLLALPVFLGTVGRDIAHATDIAAGTSGTVDWVIDAEGVLTLTPSGGADEGTLASSTYEGGSPWKSNSANITSFKVAAGKTVYTGEDATYLFRDCVNLTTFDATGFDTSKTTNMRGMFLTCSSLTSLDVSGFDTSKVTNMQAIFQACTDLISLDLSKFNTAKVTSFTGAFLNCTNLTSLDVSSFNTSSATSMYGMIANCPNLTSLDVSSFDTSNVDDLDWMLSGNAKLSYVDLSGFRLTIAETTAWNMFSNTPLTSVKLGDNTASLVKSAISSPVGIVLDQAAGIQATGKWLDASSTVFDSLTSAPAGTYTAQNNAPLDISTSNTNVTFSIDPTEATHTGEEIRPTVTVKNGENLLVEGTHYTVAYKNNIDEAQSSAPNAPTVTITGIGYCAGERSATFSISPALISIDTATIDPIANHVYDGQAYMPVPTVMLNGVSLENGLDYVYEYLDAKGEVVASPTQVGTYTLRVTGIERYTDTVSSTFQIVDAPAPTPDPSDNTNQTSNSSQSDSGKTLPNTGDLATSSVALLVLGAISSLGLIGIARKRT